MKIETLAQYQAWVEARLEVAKNLKEVIKHSEVIEQELTIVLAMLERIKK
mgnify:FL=1